MCVCDSIVQNSIATLSIWTTQIGIGIEKKKNDEASGATIDGENVCVCVWALEKQFGTETKLVHNKCIKCEWKWNEEHTFFMIFWTMFVHYMFNVIAYCDFRLWLWFCAVTTSSLPPKNTSLFTPSFAVSHTFSTVQGMHRLHIWSIWSRERANFHVILVESMMVWVSELVVYWWKIRCALIATPKEWER